MSKPTPGKVITAQPNVAPYLTDAEALDGAVVGGKASKLQVLVEQGARVPAFAAIPGRAFRAALDTDGVREAMDTAREQLAAGDAAAAEQTMVAAVMEVELDAATITWVRDSCSRFATARLALRSSAIGEDGSDLSFAGQFDTILGLAGADEVLAAIPRAWAGAFGERAMDYRQRHGLDPFDVEMALVVQEMIASDVSGVLFTADPTTGDPYASIVSATWGLGEALVSGIANADTYRMQAGSDHVDADIAEKDLQLVMIPDGSGTREEAVTGDRATRPCMTDAQVRELVTIGREIARLAGSPQDIEWAIAGGELHILQARPITSTVRPEGHRRVWDNSNIVESYAGVVAPLTFSFAREAYTQVYIQLAQLARVPEHHMREANGVFRQMLGYIDGRVYYNLRSWYYLLSLFPGYERNREAMEQMMGVREPLKDTVAPEDAHGNKLRVKLSLGWWFVTLQPRVNRFRNMVRNVLERHRGDVNTWDADRLVDTYDELRLELLANWREPLVNDFAVMVRFDRLRRLIDRYGIDDGGTLQNDLLCGQGDVESAEPTRALVDMAEIIRTDAGLTRLVLADDTADLLERISAHDSDAARKVTALYAEYMTRFGDRCANDLKLETPPLQDNPAFLYDVLRNFVSQPDLSRAGLEAHERSIRENAEALVVDRLRGPIRGTWRRWRFRRALNAARERVRQRENMRFDRTRVFGLARRIFHALGHRFAEQGLIDDPTDIFYLEVEEIIGTVQGTTTTCDLRATVAARRASAERWEADDLPDRIETVGTTNANSFDDAYTRPDTSGDSISGIAACPGVVHKPVRVVESPESGVRLSGDIMACVRTDPGWVPLFPSCGGLLVERGSLLSHSAIVAREFGIPTIVGIPGLMDWVRDGETVEMDGSTGVARRSGSGDDSDE